MGLIAEISLILPKFVEIRRNQPILPKIAYFADFAEISQICRNSTKSADFAKISKFRGAGGGNFAESAEIDEFCRIRLILPNFAEIPPTPHPPTPPNTPPPPPISANLVEFRQNTPLPPPHPPTPPKISPQPPKRRGLGRGPAGRADKGWIGPPPPSYFGSIRYRIQIK